LFRSRYRSWAERTHNASDAWDAQYEILADAYLIYDRAEKLDNEPKSATPMREEDEPELQTSSIKVVDIFGE
jgi:hypothetical protein